MSFTDSLFRNSFWSYETHDIVLRRLSEINTTPADNNSVADQPERQSRFSISSEDDRPASSRSSNPIAARLSQGPQWIAQLDKALPPIPRAYRLTKRQRKLSVRNSELNPIDEISWPMPPGVKTPLPLSDDPVYMADKMSKSHMCLFILMISMAQLCAQAGIGQTLATSREIGSTFGVANTRNLTWVLAGYGLAFGSFTLIAGRLGDIYGHKKVFLAGFVWSAIWSAISGAAFYSTYALFVFSRVFHGLGVAASVPNGLALIGIACPPGKQKAMAFTFIAMMGPVGIIFGSVSASLLASAWWPVTYWASTGMLLTIAGLGHLIIPKSTQEDKMSNTITAFMTELDLPGAITGTSALVLISFAWNQAPFVGWKEPYLWIALILGSILAVLFGLIESYYAPKPLIPAYVLKLEVCLILFAGACGWSCFGIWAFYTWQFVENIRGASPLLAAAYVSPCIIVGCLTTLSMSLVLHRLGALMIVSLSLLSFTLGSALVVTMPAIQSYWSQLFISVLVVSWAMDTGFPVTALTISNVAKRKDQGMAASLVSTAMNYSISVGLGIARTVESYVNRSGKSTENKLIGYRAALYTALGLAGLGTLICFAFLLKTLLRERGKFYSRFRITGRKS